MCFASLDLIIAEMSAKEPWFHMMEAVRQYAQNTSLEDSTSLQKDVIQLYPSDLFPSHELLIRAPQMGIEDTSPQDQRTASTKSETDNAGEYCDTLSNSPFDGDDSIHDIEIPESPTSSLSVESLSCYSSESEETTSSGSESTFDSLFVDSCAEHCTIFQNVKSAAVVLSEVKLLNVPISLENCSWTECIESLAADDDWDNRINESAEEVESKWGFNSELLSNDGTIPGSSAVINCDEEQVGATNTEELVSLPQRSLGCGDVAQTVDPLFDGEDSMIEFKELGDDDQALEETNYQSYDLNSVDQERQENQFLAAQRHSRAIRLNPYLSHLFD